MKYEQKKFIFNQEKYESIKRNEHFLLVSNELFKVLYLNETAQEIIKMLNGKVTIETIKNEIVSLYGIPKADVKEYVGEFIEKLKKEGVICEVGDVSYSESNLNEELQKIYFTCAKKTETGSVEKMELVLFSVLMEKLGQYIGEKGIAIFVTGLELLERDEIDSIFHTLDKTNIRVYLYLYDKKLDDDIYIKYKEIICAVILPMMHIDTQINDEKLYLGNHPLVNGEIEKCKTYKIPLYISVMPTEKNIENLTQIYQFAYNEKLQGIFIENNLQLKNSEHYEAYEIAKIELIKKNNFYDSWRNNRLKSTSCFNLVFDEDRCFNGTNSIIPKYHCGLGVNIIYVDQKANIFPCHMLKQKEMCIGKIDAYIEHRKYLMNIGSDNKCKRCNYWIFCLGGCRAENLLNNKALEDVNVHCQRRKEFYADKFEKIF